MINRIKQIITDPKKEWEVIAEENVPHAKVFTGYILPSSLIPAVAAFIGYGVIGYSAFGVRYQSLSWGIRQAVVQWAAIVIGIYLTASVINFLAEHFGAKKDFDRAFSLVAYSYTPMFVAGIFYILPSLAILAMIAGLYGLYILYIGMLPMMKAPADKNTGYFVISLIATIVVSGVISAVLTAIMLKNYFF
ncbi:MAG: YIP1 family protein [Flavobacteriaceae bacterium]|jgi:hypothetical protein|nr:YIP1 family protein [Flavobacteriaceae bacterium]